MPPLAQASERLVPLDLHENLADAEARPALPGAAGPPTPIFRPTLPTFGTLLVLTLGPALAACALVAERILLVARQPTPLATLWQVVLAAILVGSLVLWLRGSIRQSVRRIFFCAASASAIATPALVYGLYPRTVSPRAEQGATLAGWSVGIALVLVAFPPILAVLHVSAHRACDVAERTALSSGLWLAIVAVVTRVGAPPALHVTTATALLLASALLLAAALKSRREARRLGDILSGREPRYRLISAPDDGTEPPPLLMQITPGEKTAWLVRVGEDAVNPYRSVLAGLPVASVPVPAALAQKKLARRATGAFVGAALALVAAVVQAFVPNSPALQQVAIGEIVSVRASDGAIESTGALLQGTPRLRQHWAPTPLGAPARQILSGTESMLALSAAGKVYRLTEVESAISRADRENKLPGMQWVPLPHGDEDPIEEIAGNDDALLARTRSGEVLSWFGGFPHVPGPMQAPERSRIGRERGFYPVPGIHDVAAIAAGTMACALHRDGRVSCWIAKPRYAMPEIEESKEYGSSAPRIVIRDPEAVQVTAGTAHACALIEDGSVECWGGNDQGQIGHTIETSLTPVRVEGLFNVVEVHARGDTTCARLRDLRVFCWGKTRGNWTEAGHREAPREVTDLPDVVSFDADENGVCGVRPDGRLACVPVRTPPRRE